MAAGRRAALGGRGRTRRPGCPRRAAARPRAPAAAREEDAEEAEAAPWEEPRECYEYESCVPTPRRDGGRWAARFVRERPGRVALRVLETALRVALFAVRVALASGSGQESEQRALGTALRRLLEDLGPAYAKLGQAASTRPDVVPPDVLAELAALQDAIPPFADALALATVEEELHPRLVGDVFSELSEAPIAAASLGQVYKGRLRATGEVVAVKVQRPGVRDQIALDLVVLRLAAQAFRRARRTNTDLPALVDEWGASLFRELDYREEAANGVRFAALFGHLPDVKVPRMYEDLTSERVLVMEWVDGVKLSDVQSSAENLHLVEVGVYCSLSQLLDSGFYHADPHPGNLLRTRDGQLAYIDFGMCGELRQDMRGGLVKAAVHLVNREYDRLADDFVDLDLLPDNEDISIIVPVLTGVFEDAMRRGVASISFGELAADLGTTMFQYRFRIPAAYTLIIRSLALLEGIAIANDPDFKVLASAYPWIARKVLTDDDPRLRDTLQSLLYKDGAFQYARLQALLGQADQMSFDGAGQRRVVRPAGAARRDQVRQRLEFAMSPEMAFVRDSLLNEVAKGIEAMPRRGVDMAADLVLPAGARSTLPRLTTAEDTAQLEGLRGLSSLMLRAAGGAATAVAGRRVAGGQQAPPPPPAAASETVAGVLAAVLRVKPRELVLVAAELTPQARNEFARLPLALAAKLAARTTAKGVRTLLAGSQP